MMNPSSMPINVVQAYDPHLDAWKGGTMLARNHFKGNQLKEYSISKAQYEECGHHYLKEPFCSNFLYGQRPKSMNLQKPVFHCETYKRARV